MKLRVLATLSLFLLLAMHQSMRKTRPRHFWTGYTHSSHQRRPSARAIAAFAKGAAFETIAYSCHVE